MFNFAEKITNWRKGLQGFSSAFGLLKAQTKLHLVLLYSDALRQQSVLNRITELYKRILSSFAEDWIDHDELISFFRH